MMLTPNVHVLRDHPLHNVNTDNFPMYSLNEGQMPRYLSQTYQDLSLHMLNSVMCFERLGGVYVFTCICIDWCKSLFREMLFLYFLNESKVKNG